MRFDFPVVFYAYLKSMGKEEELKELYDGTITPYNYTWYLLGEVFPMLNKKRADGEL